MRIDASEALRELAGAAGGEAQLESRLKQIQIPEEAGDSKARVIALVDEQGKVLQAQPGDAKAPASLVEEAKALTLAPISWPEHSFRSIRTIEFRLDGAKWSPRQSHVATASELSAMP